MLVMYLLKAKTMPWSLVYHKIPYTQYVLNEYLMTNFRSSDCIYPEELLERFLNRKRNY